MDDVFAQKPWLRFYDEVVPPTLTYPMVSYGEFIREAFEKDPDRVALYYMGARITFRELDTLSNQFAHFLINRGCKAGDVVGVHTPNIPAWYISAIGIQKAGCVYSGVSPLLSPEELVYQLNDSGAKVLVTMDLLFGLAGKIIDRTGVRTVAVSAGRDFLPVPPGGAPPADLGSFPGVEVSYFTEAIRGMPSDPVRVKVHAGDTCLMMYTGGTTGLPKGAILTHNNMVHHIVQMSAWFDLKKGELTGLSAFPNFHQAGNFMSMWCLSQGCSIIVIPNPRDLQYIVTAIKQYKPNAVINVPTIYIELMKLPEFRALDFSGVKWFMSGASAFPAENIKEFENIVGKGKLIEVVGMTETSPVLTSLPYQGMKKVGSVGIPIPDTEIKLIDPETGRIVGIGEPGELVAKGPQVFTKGYHNKPEETANALRDGWIYTGDIAEMDADGYFYIVDRLKDMVSVSGFKVFTRQVDDVLIEHPDVAMAATIGLPDPQRPGSEIVASAIVLKPGSEKNEEMRQRILEYIKAKVSPYKVPKVIEFMDQLPMSAVGKILKRELRILMRPQKP